jgi:hypothetical protein
MAAFRAWQRPDCLHMLFRLTVIAAASFEFIHVFPKLFFETLLCARFCGDRMASRKQLQVLSNGMSNNDTRDYFQSKMKVKCGKSLACLKEI